MELKPPTKHQMERVEALRAIVGPARFVGAAGTGKSTVALQLPSLLGWGERTLFAAPTHKALHVLRGKARDMGLGEVHVSTVASLLWGKAAIRHCAGCPAGKRRPAGQGQPECDCTTPGGRECPEFGTDRACGTQDSSANPLRPFWDNWDNVIVDESSMLLKRDYDGLLRGAAHLAGRVVFVGDHCQLPPVYTSKAELARAGIPEGWGCLTHEDLPEVRLVEPHRQSKGQVLTGARAVRDVIEAGPSLIKQHVGTLLAHGLADPDLHTQIVVAAQAPPEWTTDALLRLGNAVPGADWRKYAMVVHTHAQRLAWNALVRRLAGRPADAPGEGDILISAEKFDVLPQERGPMELTKWERAVVLEVVKHADPAICRDLKCPCGGRHPDPRFIVRLLVEEHEEPILQCVSMCELGAGSGKTTRWRWGYATTVHSAQGAGWPTVLYQDSHAFPDPKRVYTAATRTSGVLMVFDTAPGSGRVRQIPAWVPGANE